MHSPDLDTLKRADRSRSAPRSKSWLIFPGLLTGFLLLCLLLFGERLLPQLKVQTAPAILLTDAAKEAGTKPTQTSLQPLSQASGWIEPDPYPIRVPVRVDGLVETVEVLAGQRVKKGQLLATLDPVDLEVELKSLEAALRSAVAARKEKEQLVRRADAECARAKAGVDAARARLHEQQDRLRRVLALDDGVIPEDDRLQVEREVAVGKAELAAAEAEWQGHLAHRQVEEAGVETALARVAELEATVERARIDLERTRILSPVDGVVLKRYASPGGKRMRGMDDPDSATVVSLFDPEKLQVRVDVPLADAAGVETGMAARIKLSAFPEQEFRGEVTRIVGEADLTRNTLQVKVAIRDPDPRMRPEMLCRVEFLRAPNDGNSSPGLLRGSESVWIPEQALSEEGVVWVVDPVSRRARPRDVETGNGKQDGFISVSGGLRPGERVVLGRPQGLKPGVRVNELQGEEL